LNYLFIYNYNQINYNLEFEVVFKLDLARSLDQLDFYKERLDKIKKEISSLIEQKFIVKDTSEYDAKELFTSQEVYILI